MTTRAALGGAVLAAVLTSCARSGSEGAIRVQRISDAPPTIPDSQPTFEPILSLVRPTTFWPIRPPPVVPTHPARLEELAAPGVVPPVGVRIGTISVDSPVVPVGVDPATAEFSVPIDPATVGWYQHGPAPGAEGSAVLAGHLDWRGEPGAFVHLADVHAGDVVEIAYQDGSFRSFAVTDVRLIPKASLPSDLFARDGPSRLILITCGGDYDSDIRRYRHNVVATATPVATREGSPGG
jgi:Sortase domain